MSHWTTCETIFTDINALRAAAQELGLELLASATARGYGNQKLKADYVIVCDGPYDIAIQKDHATGKLNLTTDWYMGHVAKQVGPNFGKLTQAYAVHKATAAARAKGYIVNRKTEANGHIKLTVTGNFQN